MGCCENHGLGPTDDTSCNTCLTGADGSYGKDACMQLIVVTLSGKDCTSGQHTQSITQGGGATGTIVSCDGTKYNVALDSGSFNTHDTVQINFVDDGKIPSLP